MRTVTRKACIILGQGESIEELGINDRDRGGDN